MVAFEGGQSDDYAQGTAVVTPDDISAAELSAAAFAPSAPPAPDEQPPEQPQTPLPTTASLTNSASSTLRAASSYMERHALGVRQNEDPKGGLGDGSSPKASEAFLVYA